jgi:hypothetical protein
MIFSRGSSHPPRGSGFYPGADAVLAGAEISGLEGRGDILLALKSGMSVVDMSVADIRQAGAKGYPFIPLSVETYSRLEACHQLLRPAGSGGRRRRAQCQHVLL